MFTNKNFGSSDKPEKNAPVAISRCGGYDLEIILAALRAQFNALGINPGFFTGKRVVIKPNLVMALPPERMATTHPAVVEAAIRLINESEPASVTLAESPGGLYQPGLLRANYNATGMSAAARNAGAELNFDVSASPLHTPSGKVSKMFEIIKPVAEAEVIVNISKLKTHALTQLSAAVKNYYGVIAGTEKVAMHARFSDYDRFFKMIVDLCDAVSGICPTLNIVDGIIGMEGNGPTGGSPKAYGCIICGRNAFNVDIACEEVLGLTGLVGINEEAKSRGLCAGTPDKLNVIGPEPPSAFRPGDMVYADTKRGKIFFNLPSFLIPKPVVDRKICVGCGVCAESCPVKTISIVNRKARIAYNKCVRCYCCQELCRFRAVKIKKNILLRLAK